MSTSTHPLSTNRVCRLLALTTLGMASLATTVAQPSFSVTELATPAGYDSTSVGYINDQGFVAGAVSRANDAVSSVAAVWKNGTVTLLGTLKDGTYSVATAVNSKGVTVGDGDDGDGRPLGWVSSGSQIVNFFSNNGGNTRPIAINDLGEIGGYYIKGFDSQWRGAIWKVNSKDPRKSTKLDLPILPGNDPATVQSVSLAFNKYSQAAGYESNPQIGQHAVFWNNDAAHTVVDLGVFGSDWSSLAFALNDFGQVVGTSHPPFGSRPVLWNNDAAHTPYELPLLPGDNYGNAQLINNNGTIIGSSTYGEPGTWNTQPARLVIWINGQIYPLDSLLDPSGAGWTICAVTSINNLDQLAGLALRDGTLRSVVLNRVR